MPISKSSSHTSSKQNTSTSLNSHATSSNKTILQATTTLINLASQKHSPFLYPCLLLSQNTTKASSQSHPSFSFFLGNPLKKKTFYSLKALHQWESSIKKDCGVNSSNTTTSKEASNIPLHSGWVGYYSYSNQTQPQVNPNKIKENHSRAIAEFYYYPWAICLDHNNNEFHLLGSPDEQAKEALAKLILDSSEPAKKQQVDHTDFSCTPFTPKWNKDDYQTAFNKINEYLLSGDCYQVNLTHPHKCNYKGSALNTLLPLYESLNPDFGCYFQGQGCELVSVSPERFIKIDNKGRLEAKPIKGTIKRSPSKELDDHLISQLTNSVKDKAENLMIVDLLRNDLSISAKPGSVKVDKLFEVESHPNVHHLVSTISAQLKHNISHPNAISSAFPGGSITGTPKKRAMEIIEELEYEPRSLYCGSFGYYSDSGHTDFNILIRSLEFRDNTITCWGGGGITVDSSCDEEYEESLTKIRRIMKVVESLNA